MRSRLPLAFLISVASCLAFTASAWACPTTTLVFTPKTAGPGDTVSYSIAGIVPNATYSFTIAGREISGTNTSSSDNGVSGTFTMPDLGSQQLTLTAHGSCSCPDSSDNPGLSASMEYLPPPPPASSGPPQGSVSTPATVVPAHSSQQPKTSAKKQAPAASPSHSAAAPSAQSSGGGGAVVGTEVAGPQPANTPSDSSPRATAKERTGKTSSSVPNQVLDTIGGTTSVGPAKVPTLGLLAIALIVIVGLGLAGLAIYIFRNGPDPDAAVRDPAPTGPDPIEAELQQIIADEMARQLVSDLNLGEPTKVSSK
jgi:hypothetical protein